MEEQCLSILILWSNERGPVTGPLSLDLILYIITTRLLNIFSCNRIFYISVFVAKLCNHLKYMIGKKKFV